MSNQKSHRIINGVELKYCCRCYKWKTLNSFYEDKRYIDGLSSFCKKYYQQYGKKYKEKNKIRIAKDKKRWDLSNPEKRKAIRKKRIKKVSSTKVFNFEKISDDDFQSCWALSNLQLLPATKNISKGSKIVKHFQPSLIF